MQGAEAKPAQILLLSACRHEGLPITTNTRSSGQQAVAFSRRWALEVALVASKPGGLCEQLHKQLCSLRGQMSNINGSSSNDVQRVRGNMLTQVRCPHIT
jgi:hypothetical protein